MAGVLVTLLCLASAGAVTGCSPGSAADGRLTVFAAASLTEAFTTLGKAYEREHPDVTVLLNFGSSSALARQLTEGAPADVFAAADQASMARVVPTDATDHGDATAPGPGRPRVFARNELVIAVPSGNPGDITKPADLTRPGVRVAVCAPQVPCGAAATRALAAAAVRLTPATQEQDVKATLTKLRLGEVDAALVYRTDVLAASGDVDGVEFPKPARTVNDYPIVALPDADHPDEAAAFVAFVLSEPARRTLADAGFLLP